jgi:hypothetical protein
VVKRTREDYKRLTNTHKKHNPKKMIHKNAHGNLNKKANEAFFRSMVDDPEVLNSRYFLFFLRADDEAFKKRSEDDFNWVKSMANKFSQNNDYEIK